MTLTCSTRGRRTADYFPTEGLGSRTRYRVRCGHEVAPLVAPLVASLVAPLLARLVAPLVAAGADARKPKPQTAGSAEGRRPRRLLPYGALFRRRGRARPEVPPAFPGDDVRSLDFPQECTRLDSFGGQQPRGGVGRRRAPGGARTGAESTSRGAHDGSLPRLADASCKRCHAPTNQECLGVFCTGVRSRGRNARGVPVSILLVMHEL